MNFEEKSGSIWERKTKKGNDMLSIKIGDESFIAFRNKSDNPKAPQWNVYKSDEPQKQNKPDDSVPF